MGYDAFISYSHAADGKLAPALQVALEQYAKAWYRRRALHVFRDETNLSANPHLWQSICDHLNQSEWFILMASPNAAKSKWVSKEVIWWLDHRPSNRMLIVLTEGELQWNEETRDFDWGQTTALPQALQGKFSEEVLYVDLRWAKSESRLTLQHTKFRHDVLRVAARIHDLSPDEMDGEAVQIHRKNIRSAAMLIVALVIMGGAAAWQWWEAWQQGNAARAALASVDFNEGVRRAQSGQGREALPFLASSLRLSGGNTAALVAYLVVERWPWCVMSHNGAVTAASFSPDGTRVVTASGDRTARIWDARTGTPVGAPLRHEGFVQAASFSPDGTRVVTASGDSTARIWDVDIHPPAPDEVKLLAGAGEALSGYAVNESRSLVSLSDRPRRVKELHGRVADAPLGEPTARSYLRWILDDPWTRTISPYTTVTVPDFIRAQTKLCIPEARKEVEQAYVGHPVLREPYDCSHPQGQ